MYNPRESYNDIIEEFNQRQFLKIEKDKAFIQELETNDLTIEMLEQMKLNNFNDIQFIDSCVWKLEYMKEIAEWIQTNFDQQIEPNPIIRENIELMKRTIKRLREQIKAFNRTIIDASTK